MDLVSRFINSVAYINIHIKDNISKHDFKVFIQFWWNFLHLITLVYRAIKSTLLHMCNKVDFIAL